MTLTIPADGIAEVRRVWSGRGGLWAAAAAVEDGAGLIWSPPLARRRAARVVVELLRPALEAWPESLRRWLDALPAQSVRHRIVETSPGAGVDWVATRRRGWPPTEFHHRRRSRIADTVLATTTRWTIEALGRAVAASDGVDVTALGDDARRRQDVAVSLLEREPIASARPVAPSRADLAALATSGRPWAGVAAVASWLRTLDHEPVRLAALSIDPDPVLAERLFHVAVLGVALRALGDADWRLTAIGLPGAPDGGPVFAAIDPAGTAWELWYETAGAWSHRHTRAPYPAAVAGVAGTGGPLGADLGLFSTDGRAVLVECKFSADPTYVGRNGYEQVLAYMVEVSSGLATSVSGIVVGPPEVVAGTGLTRTAAGSVRVTNPGGLPRALIAAVLDATSALV